MWVGSVPDEDRPVQLQQHLAGTGCRLRGPAKARATALEKRSERSILRGRMFSRTGVRFPRTLDRGKLMASWTLRWLRMRWGSVVFLCLLSFEQCWAIDFGTLDPWRSPGSQRRAVEGEGRQRSVEEGRAAQERTEKKAKREKLHEQQHSALARGDYKEVLRLVKEEQSFGDGPEIRALIAKLEARTMVEDANALLASLAFHAPESS